MNLDSGEMAFISQELKDALKQFDDAQLESFGKVFGNVEEAQKEGFTVPFEVGENINIKGCHFRVNNFVPAHNHPEEEPVRQEFQSDRAVSVPRRYRHFPACNSIYYPFRPCCRCRCIPAGWMS